MRILVTGGAGFIGHHLVLRLRREYRATVVVLDNLRRGKVESLREVAGEIVLLQGDIRDRAALDESIRDCELVFHLAAQSNVMGAVSDADYAFESNVQGTFHVLEAARKAAVKRVVFTSSREVYGDPPKLPVAETAPLLPKNAYGASKAAAEMYCRVAHENGAEVVVLRLANAYGLRDTDRVIPLFVENAVHGCPLVLYGGSQIVDFVSVDTVVDVLIKSGLGEYSPEPVNIGSGKGITVADLAHRVLQLTGSQSRIQVNQARQVEVSRFVADTTRAERQFGLVPPEDPLFGLKDIVEWTKYHIPVNRAGRP